MTFHLVCHDCPEEAIVQDGMEAIDQMREHEVTTGHNVDVGCLSDE